MGELHLEVVTVEKLKRALNMPQGDPADAARASRGWPTGRRFARPVEFETRYIKQTGGRGKFAVINVQVQAARRRRTIEEKVKEIEELKDPKVKPDPNNVYFVNEISGARCRRSTSRRGGGLPGRGEEGDKYPFPFVDLECDLLFGKYHDVDSSQDAFNLAAVESVPRRPGAGRHHAAGADHEGGGGLPEAVPGVDHRRHQPPAGR